ncbi:MAG TPA: cytochrome c biogenesis protein CcdA [Gaiellaceae bacterium]|nr:cytochrome c biogenesis protein CcdA [Gaiellaceae bacterium]
MAILIPIAFVAGVITAFSPCVLPVLPIILAGGSAAETRRRPYSIVAGLVVTFTVFVLAGAWLWSLVGIDDKHQIQIGAALLLLLALVLILPKAGELLERPFLFLTRRRVGDLGGGFLLGASLGLVFVPCTGPVLGAVISNVGTHRVGVSTVALALLYALGLSVPLLLIAQGSRRVASSFRTHAQTVRIAAGVVIAAVAVVLYRGPGWLTDLQTRVPGYVDALQRVFEGNHAADRALAHVRGEKLGEPQFGDSEAARLPRLSLASKPIKVPLNNYGKAPDFTGISHWLNTPTLSIDALRGRVVLVDFWTYSCINCLRTLPHLEEWDRAYRSKGLVIVGVHTPEFGFEHDLDNVTTATKRLGVRYPVALDNDYKTWNAYSNQYWPAEYLIDQNGDVRHIHFGEGDYGGTEHDIRLLLRAGGQSRLPAEKRERDTTPKGDITPESYLGYFRIDRYDGNPLSADVEASYHIPTTLPRDHFAYGGRWNVESEKIVAGPDARLRLHFHARTVNLVLGGHGLVAVVVNGKMRGAIRVDQDRLYTLVSNKRIADGDLDLMFTPGVEAYSFTFG